MATRAARRNEAKRNGIKFPWKGIEARRIEAPPVRQNKRDRSPVAEAKRTEHITMDFTDGIAGISRSMVSHEPPMRYLPKPKRGWAAKRRAAPFENYLDPVRMAKARARHIHPRRKRNQLSDLPLAAE